MKLLHKYYPEYCDECHRVHKQNKVSIKRVGEKRDQLWRKHDQVENAILREYIKSRKQEKEKKG